VGSGEEGIGAVVVAAASFGLGDAVVDCEAFCSADESGWMFTQGCGEARATRLAWPWAFVARPCRAKTAVASREADGFERAVRAVGGKKHDAAGAVVGAEFFCRLRLDGNSWSGDAHRGMAPGRRSKKECVVCCGPTRFWRELQLNRAARRSCMFGLVFPLARGGGLESIGLEV
jgi:hypothetical protein